MTVPNEIFATIFSFLPDRSSLVNAALVCKRWHNAAIPLLWMEIKLSLNPSAAIDPTLFGEAIKTSGGRECAKWIKVLSFNFSMDVMTSSVAPIYYNHITTSYLNVIQVYSRTCCQYQTRPNLCPQNNRIGDISVSFNLGYFGWFRLTMVTSSNCFSKYSCNYPSCAENGT